MSHEAEPSSDEPPGSYVSSDAGIDLPTEGDHPSAGETFEERRDREELGRPRTEMLREVASAAPTAAPGPETPQGAGNNKAEGP